MLNLTRRNFEGRRTRLAITALLGATVLALSSCSAQPETGSNLDLNADPKSVTGTVTVMVPPDELTAQNIADFNEQYPNIKVEQVDEDPVKLKALQAAGDPPDIWRPTGPQIPALVAQGQLLDLTDALRASGMDDASTYPAAQLYTVNDRQYGAPKDWSPDFTIFVNNKLFQEAGIPIPDPKVPLSWTQIGELARKLTVKAGEATSQLGLTGSWELLGPARTIQVALAEGGESLYSDDDKSIVLTSNPRAVNALKFIADLAKDGATHSPLNPSATWGGDEFMKGKVAMVNFGYWFNAQINSGKTAVGTDYTLLPAPYWSDANARINPTVSATGWVISSKSKNAQAALELLKWYIAGPQAVERAQAGWGFPALKAYSEHLPQDTPIDKKVLEVANSEAKVSPSLSFNRYYDDGAFTNSYSKHLQDYIKGQIDINEFASQIEKDVNTTIADGVSAVE
ncbi:ABC transporter substrate-binding protein [Arthrobacter sp. W4I7]|uniref:ABC transporter substrate-binding protein n=1 Tax=Arthrobacter sp. W4I7 TaxID=3042296 RepID=UPI002787415F|nr:sugar ABC transporter substrate-binding protein [Arthrobacter sp. W4I7]MDQ0691251.1 multiple sugar transport system substrate-binding protein [Arthrobacter sp. W4I7]